MKYLNKTSYEKLSLHLKVIVAVLGGIAAIIASAGIGAGKAEIAYLLASIVFFETIIILFDKLRFELAKKIDEIHASLKLNFEYHGLLDSPKADFNSNEITDLWPRLMEKTQKEFWGVNYLSRESWMEYRGDNLVPIIGQRMHVSKNGTAKRIFILDSESEVEQWEETIELHHNNHFQVRWILIEDYRVLLSGFSKHSILINKTQGFNIIDSENPGIVVDWRYNERRVDGANLLRGVAVANEYAQFFDRLWGSVKTHEFEKPATLVH